MVWVLQGQQKRPFSQSSIRKRNCENCGVTEQQSHQKLRLKWRGKPSSLYWFAEANWLPKHDYMDIVWTVMAKVSSVKYLFWAPFWQCKFLHQIYTLQSALFWKRYWECDFWIYNILSGSINRQSELSVNAVPLWPTSVSPSKCRFVEAHWPDIYTLVFLVVCLNVALSFI